MHALLLLLAVHLQPLGGIRPFVVDGVLVGGSTSWGIVVVDDGGALRVCEEAARQNAAFHVRLDDGRVLLGGPGGLYASDDDGCSLRPVLGDVLSHEIAAVAVGAGGTFVSSGRPGFPNGVFVGVDGDTRFVRTGLDGTASPLWDLVADPARPAVFVSGDDLDLEQPLLLASSDAGATWEAPAFDVGVYAALTVLGVDDDGAVFVGATHADRSGSLLRASADLSSVETVASFDLPVTHAAVLAGALAVVVEPGQLYVRAAFEPELVVVADVQAGCVWSIDQALWACGSTTGRLAGVHFARSLDGHTWIPALLDDDIRERSCPADTDGAEACAAYVDVPTVGPDAGPDDPVEEPADAGFAAEETNDDDDDDDDAVEAVEASCTGGRALPGWALGVLLCCGFRRRSM
ncbi:MAG: hypothetical protein Q8O67_26020 [Deltaproteobacteria bacterium]|nr:hypothetical protein [Deltaproteobacteria bacterium]